jgi:chemotaxis protein CheD
LIRVGMAEIKTGQPGDKLQALGLGSCVGVLFYDRQSRAAGMVHVMLPNSDVGRGNLGQPGKYADTGVPLLLEMLQQAGGLKSRLTVKIAGGAEMFSFTGSDAPRLAVGQRNIAAVREQLAALGLRIQAEDLGGNSGRTFEFDVESQQATIKVVGKTERTL